MKAAWTIWGTGICGLVVLVAGTSCSQQSGRTEAENFKSNTAIQIEPNSSVGNIRAGMTLEQVVTQMGEPPRRTSNSLEYPRLGLAVMPGPQGVVQIVMCGDVTGINGPFVKAFTGRTKEGIGMYSTRQDVIKSYGEPTSSERMRGGVESLQYQPLGITFTLEGDKVYHMIVRLGTSPPLDRSVSLEPVPNTTP